MAKRPKLTIPQQVEYMQMERGIKFNICSKEDAIKFLEESTYFFKIKSFAKNYDKKGDKYMDLDFAYLKELSTLDMYLRKEILNMSLDVEHYLKVWLMKDLSGRDEADGYEIIKKFFNYYPDVLKNVESKKDNSFCKDLIGALKKNEYPMWNVIELLSFGDFRRFCTEYTDVYGAKSPIDDFLFSVNCIRNAAAHNNCLLNTLKKPYTKKISVSKNLNTVLSDMKFSSRTLNKKLSNPVMHDFASLLIAYDRIVISENAKKATYARIKDFFDGRMVKHRDYFIKNSNIVSYYEFSKKIIDKLYSNAYNIDVEQKR